MIGFFWKIIHLSPFKYWAYQFFRIRYYCNNKTLLWYLFRTLAINLLLLQYYLMYLTICWQSSSRKQNIYVCISQKKKRYLTQLFLLARTDLYSLCQNFCFSSNNVWCAFEIQCNEMFFSLHMAFVNICIFPALFDLRSRIKIISSRLPLFL